MPLRKYYLGQHGWHNGPQRRIDPICFAKMLKMAKLTGLYVEGDIAKVVLSAPVKV